MFSGLTNIKIIKNQLLTLALLSGASLSLFSSLAIAADGPREILALDENCVVNILNRTVQANNEGRFALPNVPSFMGQIRARATCIRDGKTVSAESDYFSVINNGKASVGNFYIAVSNIPVSVSLLNGTRIELTTEQLDVQLQPSVSYPNGEQKIVQNTANGMNYTLTNSQVAAVDANGLLTAKSSGVALLSLRIDGVITTATVIVNLSGDTDNDGIPDAIEIQYGMDPNDPVDAFEDQDFDGITALDEYLLGTHPMNADTDGDGISDGEEIIAGEDGYITNPLLADSDGDGINDGLEILIGSDPTDENSGNLADALNFIQVSPAKAYINYNAIDGEGRAQLVVTGHMLDGSLKDLTSTSIGTNYQSSDLSTVSFGSKDGEVFAGQTGSAQITVTNNGKTFIVDVETTEFEPMALSELTIPGYANSVDVQGDYAYVAAGGQGLQIVDVTDRKNPSIIGQLDTDGIAIDIKVIGEIAYIADGSNGLVLIDVSDVSSPQLLAQINTAGIAQDLAIQADKLYVAVGQSGVDIFDISDSLKVFPIHNIEIRGTVNSVAVENELLAISNHNSLILYHLSPDETPMRVDSINIGQVKNLAINKRYIYVAAHRTGWRSYQVTDLMKLELMGGNVALAPRGVAVSDQFVFFADQAFLNSMTYVNTKFPTNPVFQGTINLSEFGRFKGKNVAIDNTHAYSVREQQDVMGEYGVSANTKLFIAQYRKVEDNNGVPPVAELTSPIDFSAIVESRKLLLSANATDDMAIAKVEFYIDDVKVATDTTYPYQYDYLVNYLTEEQQGPAERVLQVKAKAIDVGGNETFTLARSVNVKPDQDRDGLGDEEELEIWFTEPNDSDSDDDGLNDGDEIKRGTNPNNADTDGDGINDGEEIQNGTDPNDPNITAPTVLSTSPVSDDVDVPENAPIHIVMSEAMQLKSINPSTVYLQENGLTEVAGSARLISDDSEIIFIPDELLKDYTEYKLTLTGVRDSAGNLLAEDYSFTFTAGDTVDTEKPTITSSSPENSSLNVAVNTQFSVTMSEHIDPLSLDENSFYIVDQITSERVEGIVDLLDDGKVITFTQNSVYQVGRTHTVYLTSAIKDLFGNGMVPVELTFATALTPDTQPPSVVATSVDGDQAIPPNTQLRIRFDETLDALSVSNIRLLKDGREIETHKILSDHRRLVIVTPRTPFSFYSDYQLDIDLVSDLSGNVMPQPKIIDFSTGANIDVSTGKVTLQSPAAQQREVPLNMQVDLTLSEPVNLTTMTEDQFYIFSMTEKRRIIATLSINEDRTHLTLKPDHPLKPGHYFVIAFSYSYGVYDLAGNRMTTFQSEFYTGAEPAPPLSVSGSNLDSLLTQVPLNAPISIRFNQPVSEDCVNSSSVSLTDDSANANEVSGSVSLSSDGLTLTFTPSTELEANTNYQFMLVGLCSLSGQSDDFQLNDFQLNITTSNAVDNNGPNLVSLTPEDQSSDVNVSTKITAVFDEALDPLKFITNEIANSPIRVYSDLGDIAGDWTVTGTTVEFTPLSSLPGNSSINITLKVYDPVGNQSSLINARFNTQTFTDIEAPYLVAISPNDGAMDIGPHTDVELTFSESLDASTINNTEFVAYANGEVIRPNVYRSYDGRIVTLRAPWPAGTLVSIVATNNVIDLSGNSLVDFISTFTTAVTEIGRPYITRVTRDKNNDDERILVLYTSEPMIEASLMEAFAVYQDNENVEGSLVVSGEGQKLVFTPETPFKYGSLVQLFLSSQAKDYEGNALISYQTHFVASVNSNNNTSAPKPIAYHPSSYSDGLPLNPSIEVAYDRELNADSLIDNVSLTKNSDGSIIAGQVSLRNNNVVKFQPDTLLESNQTYRLNLDKSILGLDGIKQGFGHRLTFSTGEDAINDDQPPQVLNMSPPEGMIGVSLNPQYHVVFDEAINPLSFNPEQAQVRFASDNHRILYRPYAMLALDSDITETVSGVTDVSGNSMQTFNRHFHTGIKPDIKAPIIIDVHPDSSSEAAINSLFYYRFSEALDPLSISDNSIVVSLDLDTPVKVDGRVTLSADGQTLYWTPLKKLAEGERYSRLIENVFDLSGYVGVNTIDYFYTYLEQDTTAPLIIKTSIINEQSDVPTNTRLRVRFDEPLDPLSLDQVKVSFAAQSLPVSRQLSGDGRLLTLIPLQLLPANAQLEFSIAGVRDLSANVLVADRLVSFTTAIGVNTVPSEVVQLSPRSDAKDIPLNTLIEVLLSQGIDLTTVTGETFYLYSETENRRISASLLTSENATRLTLIPDENLQAEHQFRIGLGYGDGIYTQTGIALEVKESRFYTGTETDLIAAVISGSNIAQVLNNVAVNTPITLQLSQPVSALCVNNSTVSLSDGNNLVAGSVLLSDDGLYLTFTPAQELDANTSYSLVLNDLCDASGQLTNTEFVFTTGNTADYRAPQLISFEPLDGATGVLVSSKITAEFDELIDPISFSRAVISGNDIRVYSAQGNIAGTWLLSQAKAEFTPYNSLPGNSLITLSLNRVSDAAGNVASARSMSFTTQEVLDDEQPTVLGITPIDGSMDVRSHTEVVITFSESLDASFVNNTEFVAHANGEMIQPEVYRSYDNRTVTLSYPWPAGSLVSIVATDNIRDLSGNRLQEDFISVFTTSIVDLNDNVRPSVKRQFPANGAANVAATSSIVLSVDKSLVESSVSDAFKVFHDDELVNGILELTGDNRSLVFTPAELLPSGSYVRVVLSSQAQDSFGNAVNPYQGSFQVVSALTVGIAPTPIAYNPQPNNTDVPLNPNISIAYDQPLNETSLVGQIVLTKTEDDSIIPGQILLDNDGRVVRFKPDGLLEAETRYSLLLNSAITDIDGDSQASFARIYFTTALGAVNDDQSPQVIGMNPPEGATNVSLNSAYHVLFDEAINPLSFSKENTDVVFAADNHEIVYTPHQILPVNSEITETVSGVEDVAGNPMLDYSTHFETGSQLDTEGVELVSMFPADEASVTINSVFYFRFNEVIDPLSINDRIVKVYDRNNNRAVPGNVSLSADGLTVHWLPTEALPLGTNYSWITPVVLDLSGNLNESGLTQFYFSTDIFEDIKAPVIESTSVTAEQMNVPLNVRLRVRFDEAIDPVQLEQVKLTFDSNELAVTRILSDEGRLLTLVPLQLLPVNSKINFIISNVRDLSGNILIAEKTLAFTTSMSLDSSLPEVSLILPADQQQDVVLEPLVEVTLNERIDPTTVTSDALYLFSVTENRPIDATLSLSNEGTLLSLKLNEVLSVRQEYKIMLSSASGLYDLAGNRMEAIEGLFKTGN